MVTCTGHIGIHEMADGRTDERTYVVRTEVDDVMAIKPNFLTSMGYHIFLTMVLRARSSAIKLLNSASYYSCSIWAYHFLRAMRQKTISASPLDLFPD